jgi:hypothetical protein
LLSKATKLIEMAVEKALAPRIAAPWRVGCLGQAQ